MFAVKNSLEFVYNRLYSALLMAGGEYLLAEVLLYMRQIKILFHIAKLHIIPKRREC